MTTTPNARSIMRYGAAPFAGSTRTEAMPGPAQPPPLAPPTAARSRLEGLSRELMALRLRVDDAVARATLDAMAGEVMAVRALLTPTVVVSEAAPEPPSLDAVCEAFAARMRSSYPDCFVGYDDEVLHFYTGTPSAGRYIPSEFMAYPVQLHFGGAPVPASKTVAAAQPAIAPAYSTDLHPDMFGGTDYPEVLP